jgi:hypothetical protein
MLLNESARSGGCNTILEAMACGCPVVARDVPATREMIEHGKTGWLAKDAAEIVEIARKLYGKPNTLAKVAKAARAWVEQWGWEGYCDELASIMGLDYPPPTGNHEGEQAFVEKAQEAIEESGVKDTAEPDNAEPAPLMDATQIAALAKLPPGLRAVLHAAVDTGKFMVTVHQKIGEPPGDLFHTVEKVNYDQEWVAGSLMQAARQCGVELIEDTGYARGGESLPGDPAYAEPAEVGSAWK